MYDPTDTRSVSSVADADSSVVRDGRTGGQSHHANGFILLRFEPPVVRLKPGEEGSVRVNVTVHDSASEFDRIPERAWVISVRPCCSERSVARIKHSPDGGGEQSPGGTARLDHIRLAMFTFNVTLEASDVGRTSLKFYVTKNCSLVSRGSSSVVDHGDCGHLRGEDSLDQWGSSNPDGGERNEKHRLDRIQSSSLILNGNEETRNDFRYWRSNPGNGSQKIGSHFHESDDISNSSLDGIRSVNESIANTYFTGSVQPLESLNHSNRVEKSIPVNLSTIIPTSATTNDSDLHQNFNSESVDIWWIPQELVVIVGSPVDQSLRIFLEYFVMLLMAVNLIGIGGQIDRAEAVLLLRNPSGLALGLFCRYALLPAVRDGKTSFSSR